ncbi:MAG: DUF2267 domain-containing protein [Planctomycetota bacterium]
MTSATIPVFQQTLEKTNNWLDEIMELLDWSDRRKAYKALRVVLHTLRDRLTTEEVTDLASQMPMLIRGMYLEGWNPNANPQRMRSSTAFVQAVNQNFTESDHVSSNDITFAVLKVLERHISQGEIEDVVGNLPKQLQELWSEARTSN